ncbi:MAG: hypothetical protein JWO39_1981 [Gemmatimonadetes bacterium]|nr:hypothetical protein [Gemmatimonadota bacterium]
MSLWKGRDPIAYATRCIAFAAVSLGMLLTIAPTAAAQNPWTVEIKPSSTPLITGACTPIRLTLLDATGKDTPRNPTGMRVSLADFDMTVSPAGALVGRYDGAAAWSACACPATTGTVATITASYPAKALADKARVPGVTFQSTTTVPVVEGKNISGVPIGCETIKTTTVQSGSAPPWTVAIAPGVKAIAIGGCTPIRLDLRDASGKEWPRNPSGQLLSLADFDMAVTASGGTVAGKYDGPATWAACGCQGSTVGAPATITATYPARSLPDASRVRGVAFQSSVAIPLSAAQGSSDPAPCIASTTTTIASSTGAPVREVPARPAPVGRPVAAPPSAPAGIVQAAPIPLAPGSAPVAIAPGSAPVAISPATAPVAVAPSTTRAPMPDAITPAAGATPTEVIPVNPTGFTAEQTGDGQVKLAWKSVSAASYYVVLGPGSINGGVKVTGDTTFTVTGVPVGSQEFKVASYYEPGPTSTPGTSFPSATVNVAELLSGWVDLHTHPMINLAFGGKLIHGGVDVGSLLPTDNTCANHVRATSMAQALGEDRPSHGGWNLVNFPCGDNFRQVLIHEFQDANGALTTGSPANGFPNFDQWPKWNDLTHQKMWYEWIKRARDGGLRVMVALATNNTTLGDAVSGPGDGPTDDRGSADLQLAEIKSFVARHPDFMEVALNAADIKRIVKTNRIAVVLGMEVDNIGNFNKMRFPMLPEPAQQLLVSNEMQRLYASGVRYVIPVHIMDNVFGGTAIYKNDFNYANLREAGYYWTIECANVQDNITHAYAEGHDVLRAVGAFVKLGLDPLRVSGPPPVCPPAVQPPGQPAKSRGMRNARSLTPLGAFAIKTMMKKGMLIDIDHMGQKTADAVLDIAETFGYPVISGHTGIRGFGEGSDAENSRTPAQLTRISKLHGMFGLGSDGVHSTTFARNYQQAILDMGYMNPTKGPYENGAVGFGTDLNGLVKGPMPGGNINGHPRVVYGDSIPKSSSGTKSWDYNTEGVAHYGMMWDFVRDLRNAPSNGYRDGNGAETGVAGPELVDKHLFRSANYFWGMWQRVEAKKAGVQ